MFKEILATYMFTKLLGKERSRKLSISLQKYTIKTSAIVFGFIAIAHTVRLVLGVGADIAGWAVPMWFSLVISVCAGYLSFGLWKMK